MRIFGNTPTSRRVSDCCAAEFPQSIWPWTWFKPLDQARQCLTNRAARPSGMPTTYAGRCSSRSRARWAIAGVEESEPNRGRALPQIEVCMGGVCCIAGRLRLVWLLQQPIGVSQRLCRHATCLWTHEPGDVRWRRDGLPGGRRSDLVAGCGCRLRFGQETGLYPLYRPVAKRLFLGRNPLSILGICLKHCRRAFHQRGERLGEVLMAKDCFERRPILIQWSEKTGRHCS